MTSDSKTDVIAETESVYQALREKVERSELTTKEEAAKSWSFIMHECSNGAVDQLSEACTSVTGKLAVVSHYNSFVSFDAQESALARLIVILSEGAVGCVGKARNLDAVGREIELSLGSKLGLTVAHLSDAMDRHRGRGRKE